MLFTYGFIDGAASSAKALYLDLEMADDDPLKGPKLAIARSTLGFHVVDEEEEEEEEEDGKEEKERISWKSDLIWLMCINEEDGLSFRVQERAPGERELLAFWKEVELTDASKLRTMLEHDGQWHLYLLRAVCTMQDRVRQQLGCLAAGEEGLAAVLARPTSTPDEGGTRTSPSTLRVQPLKTSKRLRELEGKLLEKADGFFENEVGLFIHTIYSLNSTEYSLSPPY